MTRWSTHLPVNRALRRWLAVGGSLSARLAKAGPGLQVRRLRQGGGRARSDEATRLGGTQAVLRREVVLSAGGAARVVARSLTPRPAALGPWRAVGGLGQRPLADVLFGPRAPQRSALQFARLTPHSPAHQAVRRALAQAEHTALPAAPTRLGALWARRSVFWRRGAPLMVTEVFLPSVAQLPAPGAQHWTPAR